MVGGLQKEINENSFVDKLRDPKETKRQGMLISNGLHNL
jgi:hypothetical protein